MGSALKFFIVEEWSKATSAEQGALKNRTNGLAFKKQVKDEVKGGSRGGKGGRNSSIR